MYKKLLGLGIGLMFFGVLAYADNMETITLTTYYPAPYGVYFQLAAKRLSVGLLTAADQPNHDGSIRFQPQTGDPTTAWTSGQPGELAYSQDNDKFYHYNSSNKWVSDSSASGTVMYLDCGQAYYSWAPPSPCVPASCPAGWTSVTISTIFPAISVDTSGIILSRKISNVCMKN